MLSSTRRLVPTKQRYKLQILGGINEIEINKQLTRRIIVDGIQLSHQKIRLKATEEGIKANRIYDKQNGPTIRIAFLRMVKPINISDVTQPRNLHARLMTVNSSS
jgi:hypothetical protein